MAPYNGPKRFDGELWVPLRGAPNYFVDPLYSPVDPLYSPIVHRLFGGGSEGASVSLCGGGPPSPTGR
eukprot:15431898-Alexandrium_andersonii.AAC.1